MKIFLSHTYTDKPVVEPIALRLRDIFGQNNVFYDAWSIQPGDGIIQKMNEGLAAPDFVFFFVSAASLKSKMVEFEWHNALYSSTKGKVKIIPVRVDGTAMPAILMQNVWIDLFALGIEAAIQQIVSVVQGMNTFTPQHRGFQNLSFEVTSEGASTLIIIRASHLMEPNPKFIVLVENGENEIRYTLADGAPFTGGFNPDVMPEHPGLNGIFMAPLGGAITPSHPLTIKLIPNVGAVKFRGVFHQSSSEKFTPLLPASDPHTLFSSGTKFSFSMTP